MLKENLDNIGSPSHSSQQNNNRYPRRELCPLPQWFIASSAKSKTAVSVTTSDGLTLRQATPAMSEECELWKMAIDDELLSPDSKQTWACNDNPKAQSLFTHVVLEVKRRSNGSAERFKARIMASGNFQAIGEHFDEVYDPFVSFTALCMFLYVAVHNNMYQAQLDAKTAFLNGVLSDVEKWWSLLLKQMDF